jgi:hypothetical protein
MLLQTDDRKEFFSTFLTVVFYAIGFYCLQFFLYSVTMVQDYPTEHNLKFWDAAYYESISKYGYVNPRDPMALSYAFFPLFPLVWKVSHLGVWGISALNILFLATGFGLLCTMHRISLQNKLLWLSLPAVFFAFIPYTEALYFMLAAMVLYGIRNEYRVLIWVSLFLLALTRASGVFLVPALLATALMQDDNRRWLHSLKKYVVQYLSPIVCGSGAFMGYEWYQTGNPYAFYDIQKNWSHHFKVPVIPFINVSGATMAWISAVVFFVLVVCALLLAVYFFRWLFRNQKTDVLLVLSCAYLFVVLLETLFYNTADGRPTNLAGIMRYATLNPFFYVVLYHFTSVAVYTWRHYLAIVLLSNLVWFLFPISGSMQVILCYEANTLLLLLFMLHANTRLQWPVIVLTAVSLFFQVHYFEHFIRNIYTE